MNVQQLFLINGVKFSGETKHRKGCIYEVKVDAYEVEVGGGFDSRPSTLQISITIGAIRLSEMAIWDRI